MQWAGRLIRMSGVLFVLVCCVLMPAEYLRGSLHGLVALLVGLTSVLIGAMLIGIGNRMIANVSTNQLTLTPNSPQQRLWRSIMQLVWVRFPVLGLLVSFVLIILGAMMVLGALNAVTKGKRANLVLMLGIGTAMISGGSMGLRYSRKSATQKVIEQLRGEAPK